VPSTRRLAIQARLASFGLRLSAFRPSNPCHHPNWTLRRQPNAMKFLIDILPVIAFFVGYYQSDMYGATAAVMVACALQTAGYRIFAGVFDRNHVLALGLVLPFGALTLILRDPTFIKWNGTVELWLLAAALVASQFIGDRPLIERMMGAIELPRKRWRQLNTAWVLFFLFSGACNIVVAYGCDEETWVNFRMFGMIGMSVVFVGAQMFWLMKWVREMDEAEARDEVSASAGDPPADL
jgi:intracellular septation protein